MPKLSRICAVAAPERAGRYSFKPSTRKTPLRVRVWQSGKEFTAIALGHPEVFTAPSFDSAFKTLAEHYEAN